MTIGIALISVLILILILIILFFCGKKIIDYIKK